MIIYLVMKMYSDINITYRTIIIMQNNTVENKLHIIMQNTTTQGVVGQCGISVMLSRGMRKCQSCHGQIYGHDIIQAAQELDAAGGEVSKRYGTCT